LTLIAEETQYFARAAISLNDEGGILLIKSRLVNRGFKKGRGGVCFRLFLS
jgi:hypothetical protein